MNKMYKSFGIILIITFLFSCEDKPTPPVIVTTFVTDITTTSANSGGNITSTGGADIVTKGICWNITDYPTIDDHQKVEGGGALSFTSSMLQLLPSTTYYVRAYAINSAGTSYGQSVSFKTLGDKPGSNPQCASNLQLTTVTLNGTVNPNSLETIVTFEYGVTTNYGSTAIAQQSPLSGDSDKNVSVDLTGLAIGTTYHFRIKAENSLGTTYSSDLTFTTLGAVPTTITPTVDNLQVKSVRLNGSVNPNYISSTVSFEWGTTINFGNSITATPNPLTGSDPVSISAELSGLLPGTTYYARIKAENSLGTSFSSNISFTTLEFEWLKSTDFPGETRRDPLSFTYNEKGYYGLGSNSNTGENLYDLWSFEPSNSTWTRLNDCPFGIDFNFTSNLYSAKCLVGSKLYIPQSYGIYTYDIISDTWEHTGHITSNPLFYTSCFSVDGRAFFFRTGFADLYEFIPETGTLNKKNAVISNFGCAELNEIFVINNEAYMINKSYENIEIYHYQLQSETWEKKLEKKFTSIEFRNASFVIILGNCAYIGQSTSFTNTGTLDNPVIIPDSPSSNIWKYDCVKNEFTQCASMPGELRAKAGCFSFENSGYVIGGVTVDENSQKFRYMKDIWIMNQ